MREVGQVNTVLSPSNKKVVMTDEKLPQGSPSPGTPLEQLPKKTWKQDLSLWSGVSETNLAKMFVR